MPFGMRLKIAFAETPWTMGLVAGNLLVWLPAFFGYPNLMSLFGGALDVPHAWRWLTYPLATPAVALWLVLGLFCFYLFGAPLERVWGSLRYGRVILVLTILGAASQWVAEALLSKSIQPNVAITGIQFLAGSIFMVWVSLNREAEVRLFFVIPIVAKYLALAAVVLVFFDSRGPLAGLPTALLYVGCWKWADRGSTTTAWPSQSPSGGLRKWWSERKKSQRKSRFQMLEGGTTLSTPTRVGSLKSMSGSPAPKDPEPAEQELDRILDKIRFEGMSALTEAERATLDSQSRRLRGDQ